MANWFQKVVSGLDFWDKEENRRQREQYAREDREAQAKKAMQSAPRVPTVGGSTSLSVPQSNQSQFNPNTSVLQKAAPQQQGGFGLGTLTAPEQQKYNQELDQLTRLEQLKEQEMPRALEEEKKRTSWFGRQIYDRNWDKRAESIARNRGLTKYMGETGWQANDDTRKWSADTKTLLSNDNMRKGSMNPLATPLASLGRVTTGITQGASGLFDWVSPGHGVNRVSQALNEKAEGLDEVMKAGGLENQYKVGSAVGEVASYFIPSTAVLKVGKVGKALYKAGDTVVDKVGDANKLRHFTGQAGKEMLDPTNVSKELELISRYVGQDSARGEEITLQRLATDTLMGVGGAGLPAAFRVLRKARGSGVDAGVDAALGTRTLGKQATNLEGSGTVEINTPNKISKLDTVQVDDGIGSTNLQTVVDEVVQTGQPLGNGISSTNLDQPAYQRRTPSTVGQAQTQYDLGVVPSDELFDADSRLISNTSPYTPDTPLDVPAFQRRDPDFVNDSIKELQAIDDELARFTDVDSPIQQYKWRQEITDAYKISPERGRAMERLIANRRANLDIGPRRNALIARKNALLGQVNDVIGSQQVIPDVDDPIALAKADSTPAPRVADDAQNGSLRKVDAGVGAVDNQGNPVLNTDQRVNNALVEQGIAPQTQGSRTAAIEGQLDDATQQTLEQQTSGVESTRAPAPDEAAPRTRQTVADEIADENLRVEVANTVTKKKKLNLEEAQKNGQARSRNKTDEELLISNSRVTAIEEPEELFEVVNDVRRLGRMGDVEGAEDAIANAMESIMQFSSKAGQNLRSVRELFDQLPTKAKAHLLIDKIAKKYGAELPEGDRSALLSKIDDISTVEAEFGKRLDELGVMRQDLESGIPIDSARFSEVLSEIGSLKKTREALNGEAWEQALDFIKTSSRTSKVIQAGKTSMLASLRRLYDPIVTGYTQVTDGMANAVSGLGGRALNKYSGPGKFRDFRFTDLLKESKGNLSGAKESVTSMFTDKRPVDDIIGELQRSTRADSQGVKRTRFGRGVGDLTEFATYASRGTRDKMTRQLARQKANQLGFRGKEADQYTSIMEELLSPRELEEASQAHLRVNNLHENAVKSQVNRIFGGGSKAAKITGFLVVPFKSWASGNLHRVFTDKNILFNTGSIIKNFRGNPQRALDQAGHLVSNTAQGAVLGYGLARAGVLHNTDDNGNDWGGPFIQIGDRKITVAILGPNAVNVVLGNMVNNIQSGEMSVGDAINLYGKQASTSVSLAVSLAGNNPVANVAQAFNHGNNVIEATGAAAADVVRRYIPAFTADINAFLDSTDLNPTNEKAETKGDGFLGTQLNKTANRIPFLSQGLPRKEGTIAKDPIDRILDSTRTTDSSKSGNTDQSRASKVSSSESSKITLDEAKEMTRNEFKNKEGYKDYAGMNETELRDKAQHDDKARDLLEALKRDEKIFGKSKLRARGLDEDAAKILDRNSRFTNDKALDTPESNKRVLSDINSSLPEGMEAYESVSKRTGELWAKYKESEVAGDFEYEQDRVDAVNDIIKSSELDQLTSEQRKAFDFGSASDIRTAVDNGELALEDLEKAMLADQYLYEKGVSKKAKFAQSLQEEVLGYKYSKKGRGGSSWSKGGSKGGSGKTRKIATDIGTIGSGGGGGLFKPSFKYQKASFAPGSSKVPQIARTPLNDTSKMKKIKVKKGRRL